MTLFLQNGGLMPRTMGRVVCETSHTHHHHNNVNHLLALLALFGNNTQDPHWKVGYTAVYICSCTEQTQNEIGFFTQWERLLLYLCCLLYILKIYYQRKSPSNCICQLHANIHGLIYVSFGTGTHDLHNIFEGGPSEGS